MHTDLPKTINEALKILAYNEYFWDEGPKKHINPHPKDRETVRSLAESQYAWTEKQAKLALVICKRYLTKFQQHGMDIKKLVDMPAYDSPFRKIDWQKTIEKYQTEDNGINIEVKFPYNKKIITLIRNLKDKKGLPYGVCKYDGESKTWTFKQTEVTTYFLTLIAVRYDFKFVDKSLLDDYYMVKQEKLSYKKPTVQLIAGEIVFSNVAESLQNYWDTNIQHKNNLQKIDKLKNVALDASDITPTEGKQISRKLATNSNPKIWIDRKEYSIYDLLYGLEELDAFPLIMPVSGEISTQQEVEEFWEWLRAFESIGIDMYKNISYGFDIKEPKYLKDIESHEYKIVPFSGTKELFENRFELHQMSKQFKYLDHNTKVYFVRNRIPRTLLRSKWKPNTALITLGGGYFSPGTENLKRLLDNLPKKLYYSDSQPSSWDWNDNTIIKL